MEQQTITGPWPDVTECNGHPKGSSFCTQCAGDHDHQWVAAALDDDGVWKQITGVVRGLLNAQARRGKTYPEATRCSVCGGRKCDVPGCLERRHHGSPHLFADGTLRAVGR